MSCGKYKEKWVVRCGGNTKLTYFLTESFDIDLYREDTAKFDTPKKALSFWKLYIEKKGKLKLP